MYSRMASRPNRKLEDLCDRIEATRAKPILVYRSSATQYSLYAAVIHHGSVKTGHYTTFIRSGQDVRFFFCSSQRSEGAKLSFVAIAVVLLQ